MQFANFKRLRGTIKIQLVKLINIKPKKCLLTLENMRKLNFHNLCNNNKALVESHDGYEKTNTDYTLNEELSSETKHQ